MTRRRRTLPLGAAALAAALAVACGDPDGPEPRVGEPDPIAEGMLNSLQSPGLGLSSSLPVTGGPGPRAPQSQELDLATLGYNSGPQGAPVRVLEFSDFGCGYCRRFHQDAFPALEAEYMEAGKVEWKYVPIVIGLFPNALEAARAGECAGEQGRFPVMRDLLFDKQAEWKASDDPEVLLEGYARDVGLDVERYNRCVGEGWRDERIRNGTRLSQQVGVRGTPTFFVVGYAPIPGAIPLDLFRQVLDTVYAEATSNDAGGE
ncbi:MAG: thioredoxin domain-containing protein [Gemmatimonadales bacterium]|nr:MAG: thioredoxin domain-containing protein [Gemmatimonadales bacterium]